MMRRGLVFIAICAFAGSALARPGTPTSVQVNQYDQFTEVSRSLKAGLVVFFKNTATERVRFWVEWTQDGRPRTAEELVKRMDCGVGWTDVFHCAKGLFATPGRYVGGTRDRRFEHAFAVPDLEFDTEYCFRLRAVDDDGVISQIWSAWTCRRTIAAPADPIAPSRVQVTYIAADDGRGEVGRASPARALLEWSGALTGKGFYAVETAMPNATSWHRQGHDAANEPRIRPKTVGEHELEVPLPASFDPQAPIRFRMCSVNFIGRACTIAQSARMLSDATPAKPHAGAAAASVAEADSPRVLNARPTTRLYRPEAKSPPASVTAQGRTIMQPASPSASAATAAANLQIVCRGGDTIGLQRMDDAFSKSIQRDLSRPTFTLFFVATPTGTDAEGNGLLPSTCGFVGLPWRDGGPPAIRFYEAPNGEFFHGKAPVLKGSGSAVESSFYLDRPDRFWRFDVKEGYGFYEALSHGPLKSATPAASSPRGRLSEALPANARQPITLEAQGAKSLKTPRRSAALEAARSNDIAGRVVAATPAVVTVQETTARSASASRAASPAIQGVARASIATSLEMDCTRRPPRVNQTLRIVRPGEQFTIEGDCFGAQSGMVEIGGLPNGAVRPTFVSWTNLSIVALMPPLTSLPDANVTITVQRKSDRAVSAVHQARFVVPRQILNVPAERWTPAHFNKKETNTGRETGRWGDNPYDTARMPDGVAQFKAQINSACVFDSLAAAANVGGVREIRGWEAGLPHQADISIPWSPYCKGVRRNYLDVSAVEYELTCEIDIAIQATAVCPVGIVP